MNVLPVGSCRYPMGPNSELDVMGLGDLRVGLVERPVGVRVA